MMDNKSWGKKLAEAYQRKTGSRRNIRLPGQDRIRFDGELDSVTVTMNEKAIVANLQTNAAAFEAWSLALRVWCGVKRIDLQWQRPSANCKAAEFRHYQRFLYRAEQFRSLFQDWFYLACPALLDDAEALRIGPFYLNVPGERPANESATNGGSARESLGEADLEKRLSFSKTFKDCFGLEKVDRQCPVGLFRKSVAQVNRIFPGAKSAIDLIGVGKQGLWLFELKAGNNIPAGILSELIFYTSVMRDAIPGPGVQGARFKFASSGQSNGTVVSSADITGCNRIEAVLLGEQLHPLIGDNRVIGILNKAAQLHWNTSSQGYVPVRFRATVLKGSAAAGYQFTDIESPLDIVP